MFLPLLLLTIIFRHPLNYKGVRQGCTLFEPFVHKVQEDKDIVGIKVPGGQFHLKMSIYADDNTGIFTSDRSMKRFFRSFLISGCFRVKG